MARDLSLMVVVIFSMASTSSGEKNGLALTPPMGWMSWAEYYCQIDCYHHPYTCISETLYKEMGDQLVAQGFAAVGYRGVHIDDCWMAMQRDTDGKLVANATRFPSGIAKLADYMHSKGLTLGIYEDYGTETCGGYPGSMGHLKTDADTFAAWQVDYLKLDGCYANQSQYASGYPEMSRLLNATGRPIVYSCSWPAYELDQPQTQIPYDQISQYCNLWRNFDDISATWKSIASIIDFYTANQDVFALYNAPGAWNDPDMLVIGQPEVTIEQAKAQMSIWSIWSAPLIMSNDLRTIAPAYASILKNQKVIAVDQDPLGVFGKLVQNTTDIGVYTKAMTPVDSANKQYSFAVCVYNRENETRAYYDIVLGDLNLNNPTGYFVEDLWTNDKYGLMMPSDKITVTVQPTGVVLLKATIAQGFSGYLYESADLFTKRIKVEVDDITNVI